MRNFNPFAFWSQVPLASRTASIIRSSQIVNSSTTVANGFTGNKDFTISAVTNTAKCLLHPLIQANAINQGSSGYFNIVAGPTLANTTNLRFAVLGGGNGDATLYCAYQILEFY